MARFSESLDRAAESIKRPDPLPIGHYVMQIIKHPELRSTRNGDYDVVTVPTVVVAPTDDVDSDDVQSYGNVVGAPVRVEFMFPTADEEKAKYEGALNRFKQFAINCGVIIEDDTTVKQILASLVNTQFIGQVEHQPDKTDPSVIYVRLGRTAAV